MTKQDQSRIAFLVLNFILNEDPEISPFMLRGKAYIALTAMHRPDSTEYPWPEVIRWVEDQRARRLAKTAS